MDQRSLSVSVSAGSLFLGLCLCLSFSLLSLCVKEKKAGKTWSLFYNDEWCATICGKPLQSLLHFFFFSSYM